VKVRYVKFKRGNRGVYVFRVYFIREKSVFGKDNIIVVEKEARVELKMVDALIF